MHAITITQVIIEGFILFKHNMPLISGHITYIHIFIEFNNIYYAESNSKIVANSILRVMFCHKNSTYSVYVNSAFVVAVNYTQSHVRFLLAVTNLR